MKELTETDLAYIAGLVDGEGSFTVGRYKVKSQKSLAYRAYFQIANTHVPILQKIKSFWGGRIVEQGIGKKCYALTFSTNQIREILPSILPYLVIKKEQGGVLLDFLKRQSNKAFFPVTEQYERLCEEYYFKLKELKKIRFDFKEKEFSLGKRKCLVCDAEFEVTSKSPKKKFCSRYHLEKARWTRMNPIYYQRIKERRLNKSPRLH